jgi:hypothetical protein
MRPGCSGQLIRADEGEWTCLLCARTWTPARFAAEHRLADGGREALSHGGGRAALARDPDTSRLYRRRYPVPVTSSRARPRPVRPV